jgi:hypothetical protein
MVPDACQQGYKALAVDPPGLPAPICGPATLPEDFRDQSDLLAVHCRTYNNGGRKKLQAPRFRSVTITPFQNNDAITMAALARMDSVLPAFGYTEEPWEPIEEVMPETATATDRKKIGVIRDEQNNQIVYYRNMDGKIVMQEE